MESPLLLYAVGSRLECSLMFGFQILIVEFALIEWKARIVPP